MNYNLFVVKKMQRGPVENSNMRKEAALFQGHSPTWCLKLEHVAARTMDTIQKLKWNALPHPPYIPDLAPSDYHLFGPLKVHLAGKRFHNHEEVIQTVQEWLHSQPKDFFLSGIRKLPDRWRKCIAYQGDYVEK
jgi:hypothetical protein